jgi:hypothetical protein
MEICPTFENHGLRSHLELGAAAGVMRTAKLYIDELGMWPFPQWSSLTRSQGNLEVHSHTVVTKWTLV